MEWLPMTSTLVINKSSIADIASQLNKVSS